MHGSTQMSLEDVMLNEGNQPDTEGHTRVILPLGGI